MTDKEVMDEWFRQSREVLKLIPRNRFGASIAGTMRKVSAGIHTGEIYHENKPINARNAGKNYENTDKD